MKWLFFNYGFFLQLAWYCSQLSAIAQGQDLQQQFLVPHNQARAQVGVAPLEWDDTLAAYAQNYANKRKGDCSMRNSGSQYGENLFKEQGLYADPVGIGVMSWVIQIQYYDYYSNTCAEGEVCWHYTQVVWRETQSVGCAQSQCDNGWNYVNCNYYPPGNYNGQRPY